MKPAQSAKQLEEISTLLSKAPGESYWTGASNSELAEMLEHLPLGLAKSGKYLFNKKADSLIISEETRGISTYRITDAQKVLAIEQLEDGIYLSVKGIAGINEIILLKKPVEIPAKAKSFRSISAPVDLLDEYAELREKSKSKPLSSTERARQEDLIKLIGNEYEKNAKAKVVPSTRSTPSSYGESRGSSYRSTGG